MRVGRRSGRSKAVAIIAMIGGIRRRKPSGGGGRFLRPQLFGRRGTSHARRGRERVRRPGRRDRSLRHARQPADRLYGVGAVQLPQRHHVLRGQALWGRRELEQALRWDPSRCQPASYPQSGRRHSSTWRAASSSPEIPPTSARARVGASRDPLPVAGLRPVRALFRMGRRDRDRCGVPDLRCSGPVFEQWLRRPRARQDQRRARARFGRRRQPLRRGVRDAELAGPGVQRLAGSRRGDRLTGHRLGTDERTRRDRARRIGQPVRRRPAQPARRSVPHRRHLRAGVRLRGPDRCRPGDCTTGCLPGIAGAAPGQLNFPYEVAADGAGNVYVSASSGVGSPSTGFPGAGTRRPM